MFKLTKVSLSGVLFILVSVTGAEVLGQEVLTGNVITPAAQQEQQGLCHGQGYPAEWNWDPHKMNLPPGSATSGNPLIVQMRGGVAIATYTNFGANANTCVYKGDGTDWQNPGPPAASGCGAFARNHAWRLWAPGDEFLVYPGVYQSNTEQPWVASQYDGPVQYNANKITMLQNVKITGVVQNNVRPVILLATGASDNTLNQGAVFIGSSVNVTWSNINVIGLPGASTGKAGFYLDGAKNFTLSNTRISGFINAGQNGLFATGDNTGTLSILGVEIDHNGGQDGPTHNAYINASITDPNYQVIVRHLYSHDAYYGHLFKSRAQETTVEGSYLQGGLPQSGQTQAETYLLDVPNGGKLHVINTIFVKNASGPFSNGMSIAFGEEQCSAGGPLCPFANSLDVENNTFVSLTDLYDGQHPTFPFFLYPVPTEAVEMTPNQQQWPSNVAATFINNAFVGYCPQGNMDDYRGSTSLTEGFSELGLDYSLATKYIDQLTTIIGLPSYAHLATRGVNRKLATVGAQD